MRPVRVAYPGAIYHVTARGNGRAAVYEDDRDRRKFLGILERTAESRELHVHAYCLMGNHYHRSWKPLAGISRTLCGT